MWQSSIFSPLGSHIPSLGIYTCLVNVYVQPVLTNSHPQRISRSLKSIFDRLHAIQTRLWFNVPSELQGIAYQTKCHIRYTPTLIEKSSPLPPIGVDRHSCGVAGHTLPLSHGRLSTRPKDGFLVASRFAEQLNEYCCPCVCPSACVKPDVIM